MWLVIKEKKISKNTPNLFVLSQKMKFLSQYEIKSTKNVNTSSELHCQKATQTRTYAQAHTDRR